MLVDHLLVSSSSCPDVEDVPAAAEDSAQSDSDDCIVPSPATARKVRRRRSVCVNKETNSSSPIKSENIKYRNRKQTFKHL